MADTPTLTFSDPSTAFGELHPVRLLVVEGPDLGKEVLVSEGKAIAGSQRECALHLTDPTVSRQHASFELLGTRVRVRDLGSKNGTRYLGAKVSEVDVPVGSVVELGATHLALLPEKLAAEAVSDRDELAGMHARSRAMRRLFAEIEQVAPNEATVLIHGETGSGKEHVARAIHELSPRASGPFRVFDCGAVAPELLQSALFGHVKGAFTGAVSDASGALEQAHGGTLFLDEIGELPLDLQPSLLRALETHTFMRVGEGQQRDSDFRVVAATHRDLQAMAKRGAFRADLYYRLSVIVLEVPPLRERREDIPLLAELFARDSSGQSPGLSASTVASLCAYRWPGNVRELRNTVERLRVLGPGTLPGSPSADKPPDFHQAREEALKAFERAYLEALLDRHRGSITAAAKEAGIARSYFYRLLEAHELAARKRRARPDEPGPEKT